MSTYSYNQESPTNQELEDLYTWLTIDEEMTYSYNQESPTSEEMEDLYAWLHANEFTQHGNGGGATHIAKVTGQLNELSGHLSDILIVSGGGGGAICTDSYRRIGNAGGGKAGGGDNSGDQSSGYSFGQGESSINQSAGGGGLYGGYSGTPNMPGGGGSGYIGNPLLSNKKMVGCAVPTSEDENDKTESSSMYSEIPTRNVPKAGNGYVRIKFIRPVLD